MTSLFGGSPPSQVSATLSKMGLADAAGLSSPAVSARVAPTPPTPEAPPTMADPFSPAALQAARKAQAQALSGGRSSTILSTPTSRTGNAGGTIAGSAKLGSS